MKREEIKARVAVVVTTEIPNEVDAESANELIDFCEEEGLLPIVFLQEETRSGSFGSKGYQAVSQLIEKDMIDGVITLSKAMLDSKFGNALVADSKRNGFFVVTYEDILKFCDEQMCSECADADFLTIMMM